MGRRTGRALAAAAVAGAALAVPGPVQAHTLPQTGAAPAASALTSTMYTTVAGVPATLAAGGTIDLTVDMRWVSLFPVNITGLGISMAGPVPGAAPAQGISVLWQDPRTGAWRASDQVDTANGTWTITEPKRTVYIRAGGTLAVHLKITMSASAPPGTEHLDAGRFDYLDAAEGAVLRGTVVSHDFAGTFQFGASPTAVGGGPPTPTVSLAPIQSVPTAAPTPTPTATATATVTATPAPTAQDSSSPAKIAAVPVGNAGVPGRPQATTAPSPLSPGSAAPESITEANIVLRGANSMSTLGAVVVLLGFLAGSMLVILRSRRDSIAAAPPPPESED